MEEKKPYLYLNAFLAKDDYSDLNAEEFLKSTAQVNTYELNPQHELDGKLFVKIPEEKKPKWSEFTENIAGSDIDELGNRSSSAVLIIKNQITPWPLLSVMEGF